MTPCTFCHLPTNYIYRDKRIKNQDINLVSCCPSCAARQNSKKAKPFLSISLIIKQNLEPYTPYKLKELSNNFEDTI